MTVRSDLTAPEVALLKRIVEGGGPRPTKDDSVVLVSLLNRGFIDARKVFIANPSGVAALREHQR